MFRRKKMSDEIGCRCEVGCVLGMSLEKGEIKPSRVFEMESLDIAKIRNKTNKTQEEFAAMLNISIGTLRNWEQGRRKPDGAALSLLKIVKADPQYVEKVLLT